MPRRVDASERRLAVTSAAVRILARGGPGALTLRSLADELDGSITLVTHFFANRADLFGAIVDDLVEHYEEELEELERGDDAVSRLHRLLQWMLPLDLEALEREAGRLTLIAMRADDAVSHFFEVNERRARELLHAHLAALLPADEVEHAVEVLRVTTNGVILSAVEHPERWPPGRQLAVVETVVRALGVDASGAGS